MPTTEIPNVQSSEDNAAALNHSSSKTSTSCISFGSDDGSTAATESPSTEVEIPCLEFASDSDSCSEYSLDFTAPFADTDVDIPTTVPRLRSDPDTIGLAERVIVTPTVVNVAIPHVRSIAEHAKGVADKVFQSLEKFIVSESQHADGSYDPLRKFVQGRPSVNSESSGARFTHEKHLYTSIDAFVRFIANVTVEMAAPHDDTRIHPRKLGTYIDESSASVSNEPCEWPNAGITHFDEKIPCLSGRPDHWYSLAVIEARRSDKEKMDALEHLTIYSWNLYADRFDRNFVWGFTVCDSNFRACLYSHDNVFVSDAMDVATSEGRMQLISLLVNMSFCDASQLGYDATIRYNPAVGEWEVGVYDGERNTTDVYWIDMVQPFDTTIFGNHTRIIRCLRPSPSARADVDKDKSNYICVKDSWTSCNHLSSVRDRDEIYALRRITEKLGSDAELKGTFPKLLSGGVARQHRSSASSPSPESTDSFFAVFGDDVLEGVPKRIHRRFAATPFALPISQLMSVDELVVVVTDVMIAYMAIAKRGQILHRDISQNNIMFTRKPDGSVRGVLVDFDTAMPIEDSRLESWKPDMRGTLPFMSIGNLTISPLRRTILDDWESLIYVLCWLGTFGFSKECGLQSRRDTVSLIKEWQSQGSEWAADTKQDLMSSFNTLSGLVLRHFIPRSSYEPLQYLVYSLHNALFKNENMTPMAHGSCSPHPSSHPTMKDDMRKQRKLISISGKPQPLDINIDLDIVDPFERRLKFKDMIANELLNIVQTARSEALGRLAIRS